MRIHGRKAVDLRNHTAPSALRTAPTIGTVIRRCFPGMSAGAAYPANVAASSEYDRERATQALIKAGFGERLAAMPNGLETYLYKDFDAEGVEISGGEAQKIALARALYKDVPFIILDEPTAALDPVSEYEVYSKFNQISGDKTAIYINHRLASCRFCDKIAVFHEGRVVQQGSHTELVADENGKYYELWNAQAQYYTNPQTE